MLLEIKEKIYNLLTTNFSCPIRDNPYDINDNVNFPFIIFQVSDVNRIVFKDAFQYIYHFKFDIFSDYSGEKEIIESEEKIFNLMAQIYSFPQVMMVSQKSFKILDDKSTGTMKKHGVIYYDIVSAGMIEEGA